MFLPSKYSENCDFKSQFQHWILRTVKLLTVLLSGMSTYQQSTCKSQLLHLFIYGQIPPTKYVLCVPSDVMPGSTSSIISVAPNITPHQAARPRTKDLTLYEEYKIRRNEVRRRNLNRRRELETLPQPLLADMASQTL